MRHHRLGLFLLVLVFAVMLMRPVEAAQPSKASAGRPPNIIFIMADDLGYAELGAYGQKWIKTPHIDLLAKEGIKFTQFYSGNAVCAPARCNLMTGKHPGHAYIRSNGYPRTRPKDPDKGLFPGQHPIPDSEVTIPELLKQKGYATGGMGKWGLGWEGSSGDPNKQGFDHFFGFYCQWHAHNHYPRFLVRNGKKVPLEGNDRTLYGKQHSQDLFIDEALTFIKKNKDKPFFLYLPFAIPHLSIQTTDDWLNKYKGVIPEEDHVHRGYLKHPFPRAGYAAMVTQMDHGVGQVMKLIKELGLDDNTIIMFTSDNGPTFNRLGGSDSEFFKSAGPFKGLKGSLYEGGIRVPLVARWPGRIKPGTVTDHIAAFWDVMPTLADLSGTTAPKGIDGLSFAPTLLGKPDAQQTHDVLYWEFPGYGGQQAVRFGDWKATRQGMTRRGNKDPLKIELYNLRTDIGEQRDVSADHPDIVAKAAAFMKREHTPSKLWPLRPIE